MHDAAPPRSPHHRGRIAGDPGIGGDDARLFHVRLRDRKPVEGVYVDGREPSCGEGMRQLARQDLDAVRLLLADDDFK